nr:DNA polymerase III subunit delta [Stakelama flava]
MYLFHGPDEAGAHGYAARLAAAMGDGLERVDIEPAALRSEPGRLIDEAAALSLFGDRRLIRISAAGEECFEAVKLLTSAAQPMANPVVIIAPGLKGSGRTVKLAVTASNAISLACYVPEGAEAARLAATMARDTGVRLTGDAPGRLWELCGGDRAVLAREIEKLALFLDAASDRPREADIAALEAIAADREEAQLFETIALIVDGDSAAVGDALRTLDDGPGPVPLLRQLAKKLVTLAALRAEVDGGATIADVIERHRIFFKEKPATSRALRRWDSARLVQAIDRVRQSERQMMSSDSAGDIVTRHLGVRLADSIARRG